VTLPAPSSGAYIGIIAAYGATASNNVTITTPSGSIIGPGIPVSENAIVLGNQYAFVILAGSASDWYVAGGAQDTGWITVTSEFAASWGSSGNAAQYRKIGSEIRLAGNVEFLGSSWGPNNTVLTLPAGYRPPYPYNGLAGVHNTAGNYNLSLLSLSTAGVFQVHTNSPNPVSGDFFYLDSITFTVD
jgi:hypothetical protein